MLLICMFGNWIRWINYRSRPLTLVRGPGFCWRYDYAEIMLFSKRKQLYYLLITREPRATKEVEDGWSLYTQDRWRHRFCIMASHSAFYSDFTTLLCELLFFSPCRRQWFCYHFFSFKIQWTLDLCIDWCTYMLIYYWKLYAFLKCTTTDHSGEINKNTTVWKQKCRVHSCQPLTEQIRNTSRQPLHSHNWCFLSSFHQRLPPS